MAVFNYDEHGSAYRGAYGQRGLVLNEARRWVSIGGALSSVAMSFIASVSDGTLTRIPCRYISNWSS